MKLKYLTRKMSQYETERAYFKQASLKFLQIFLLLYKIFMIVNQLIFRTRILIFSLTLAGKVTN